ncbi:MAG: hypothetical protein WDO13_16135 [Verrucomicrobiota bacterium]
MRPLALLLLLAIGVALARVQGASAPATNAPAAKAPSATGTHAARPRTLTQMQTALDQLTQSNHDLLDLLKKQQQVLEDMQFDRRLQSRQIQSLEERMEEALQEKSQLEAEVAKLQADAAVRPSIPVVNAPLAGTASKAEEAATNVAGATNVPPADAPDSAAPPPASYLPPPSEGPPGTAGWHRVFTLKGTDGQKTDPFPIRGKTWRVLWHNQDKPGKVYANTSGLFIDAFPRDDTIPQKVCAKIGTGGDSTELQGPGNYYLRIDASGGSWELAVEELR